MKLWSSSPAIASSWPLRVQRDRPRLATPPSHCVRLRLVFLLLYRACLNTSLAFEALIRRCGCMLHRLRLVL
eukprot:scaffold53953_cov39-Tisochrysis_lutea.AAC.2